MKKILFVFYTVSLLIASVSIFPTTSLAAVSEEITIIDDEIDNSSNIIGDENFDPDIYIEKEEGDILKPQENKISGNQETLINSNSDTDNVLVEGGNEKAINPLATKENKARGTVIENVNRNGQDITPSVINVSKAEEDTPKKNPNGETKPTINDPKNQPEIIPSEESKEMDVRQFLTFQTKSGKTFYLIVDHDKNTQNVQLLTEVGEQDLLNMIEGEKQVVNKPFEETKTIEELQEEREAEEQAKKEEELEIKEEEEERKNSSPIFFIAVLLIVGVGGYYFKIYKPKQEDAYYDEDDYEDYEDSFDEYVEDDLEELKEL